MPFEKVEDFPSEGRKDGIILKNCLDPVKLYGKGRMEHIIISEVAVLMYVVLNEEEKHVPYGELVGTRECITL